MYTKFTKSFWLGIFPYVQCAWVTPDDVCLRMGGRWFTSSFSGWHDIKIEIMTHPQRLGIFFLSFKCLASCGWWFHRVISSGVSFWHTPRVSGIPCYLKVKAIYLSCFHRALARCVSYYHIFMTNCVLCYHRVIRGCVSWPGPATESAVAWPWSDSEWAAGGLIVYWWLPVSILE